MRFFGSDTSSPPPVWPVLADAVTVFGLAYLATLLFGQTTRPWVHVTNHMGFSGAFAALAETFMFLPMLVLAALSGFCGVRLLRTRPWVWLLLLAGMLVYLVGPPVRAVQLPTSPSTESAFRAGRFLINSALFGSPLLGAIVGSRMRRPKAASVA